MNAPRPHRLDPRARLTAWRAALRIARRDALRAKGRSALVMAMIALPVLGVGAADIVARSSSLTPQVTATRMMGSAAALVTLDQRGYATEQSPDGRQYSTVRGPDGKVHGTAAERARATEPVAELLRQALPAGSRLLPFQDATNGVRFSTAYGLSTPGVRELDLTDPATRGLLTLRQGHWPDAPYQIAATTAFLKDAGLRVGRTTTALGTRRPFTITAAVEFPDDLGDRELIGRPGELSRTLAAAGDPQVAAAARNGFTAGSWLVSTPGGAPFSWPQVLRANAYGVVVTSRAVLEHPPAAAGVPYDRDHPDSGHHDRTAIILLVTVVGMALLEIVLLAGPAFAVGARRSRRQLGLLAAGGGEARHVRAVVLGGGLVLGGAGALCGLLLAMAAVALGRGRLEQYEGARFDHFALSPVDLLGVVLVGVVTGLLAAAVPAVQAARQPVMASLTGRGVIRPPSRRLTVVGLAAVPLGAAAAWFGVSGGGSGVAVLGGSVLVELGVVALAPFLVGVCGRLAGRLPLGPRLALRDAARNRGRTAPAVAAVTAAVAGTVAVTMYMASQDAQDRSQYTPMGPTGSVVLSLDPAEPAAVRAAARTAVATALPDAGPRADVYGVGYACRTRDDCGLVELAMPEDRKCSAADRLPPGSMGTELTSAQARRYWETDPRCRAARRVGDAFGTVVAGDATVLRNLFGVRDRAAEQALAAGTLLVADPRYVEHGQATLVLTRFTGTTDADGNTDDRPSRTTLRLPARAVTSGAPGALALMSPALARAHGFALSTAGSVWLPARPPASALQQRAAAALAKAGDRDSLSVERGFQPQNSVILLALAIAAAVVAVAAAGVATGLAAADSQQDLATLAAVGAGPRIRRRLSGFQCAVIAGIGAVLGTAAGVVPAAALGMLHQNTYQVFVTPMSGDITLPDQPLAVPWQTMAEAVVGLPLLAWALAALLTRSRIALARRAT